MVPTVEAGVGDGVMIVVVAVVTVGPFVVVVVALVVGAVVIAAAVGAVVIPAEVGAVVVDSVAFTVAVAAPSASAGLTTGAQYISVHLLTSKLKHPDSEAVTHRWSGRQSSVCWHWLQVGMPAGMTAVGAVVAVAVGAAVAAAGAAVGAEVATAAVGGGLTVGAAVGPGLQYVSALSLTSKLKHPDSSALTHS